MTIAAAQYAAFTKEVIDRGEVFTFTKSGEFLVFKVGGTDVVPFWSTRTRLAAVRRNHPKYVALQIHQISSKDFYAWLPELEQQQVHIGVNWSGKRLTGYDVSVPDLRRALDHQVVQRDLALDGGV